jgi:hypothetical protein
VALSGQKGTPCLPALGTNVESASGGDTSAGTSTATCQSAPPALPSFLPYFGVSLALSVDLSD